MLYQKLNRWPALGIFLMCGYCIDVSGRIYGQVNIVRTNVHVVFVYFHVRNISISKYFYAYFYKVLVRYKTTHLIWSLKQS